MNILWLDLNSSYSHSSLALPSIHAQCDETHTWNVVRTNINVNVAAIVRDILSFKPDLICATAWLFTHEHLLAVLSRVKVLLPDCVIALGGPEFLGPNESYLRTHRFVDMVFRGEGEEHFPQWLDRFDHRERWKEIPGVCYLDEDCYQDGGMARVARFDLLVPPENSEFFCRDRAFVQFETARGCFNTCAFCVSGGDKPVRTISLDEVRRRLEVYEAMGIREIRLLDRTFNGQSSRALQMLDLFESFAGRLGFHLELHPALLSDAVRSRLTELPKGLLHLEAGIQSLRQHVLDGSHRLGSLEASLDGLKFLCSLRNMETHADLIAGLPGYSLEMMVEDVHTLASFGAGEIQLELLKVLPGTYMRNHAAEMGLYYSPFPPYEILKSDSMSPEDLLRSRQLSRLLDMYYNASAWQTVFSELILQESDFLSGFQGFLANRELLDQPLSLERRGLLLHEFVKSDYPHRLDSVCLAWIREGLPLGKEPAQGLKALPVLPETCDVVYGERTAEMRFYYFADRIFGFDRSVKRQKPVYEAVRIDTEI